MTVRLNAIVGIGACALLALAPGSASSQEQIKLTIISGNPPTFTAIASAIEVLIPTVNEILARSGKYKIEWIEGWSGSIVKPRGELEGLQLGLGDLAVMPGPFFPDKLTLFQIGYHTPFTSHDINVTTEAMNHLLETFPAMREQGDKFNQVILKVTGVSDNYLLFSKKEVGKFEDLSGMKIAAVGANQPWVAAAGAVPVATELATQYNAYQTGIFEGIVLWQQAYAAFKMCEIGKFRLNTNFGAVSPNMLSANKDSWAKLPEEVRSAITEAAVAWSTDNDNRIKAGSAAGLAACEKDGMRVSDLSDEDRRKWAFAMPNVAQNWAKQQDDAGLPGTEMLAAWMDFMRAKGQPVTRNWDRE